MKNLRSTTPASISSKRLFVILTSIVVMAFVVPLQMASSEVHANNFEARIRALEQDIQRYDAEAAKLSSEADSLQREVSRLTNEKAIIQAQVDLSQEKVNKLTSEIKANEEKIAVGKDTLGDIVADLYVDDEISPVEMLASSRGVNDYLDKQEYRSSTRDQLTGTIAAIKKAKLELEQQKKDVELVLQDQENQRNQLAAKESEQQSLLNQTRGDEATYKNLSAQSNSRKDQLQREQQAAIEAALRAAGGGGGSATAGDPGKGGYPAYLANSDYYNPVVDPWGMYSRQCVSYTAWKVQQKYQNGQRSQPMPYWGGVGNANQWPDNADRARIPRGSTPRAGSVGVQFAGPYGHVVWVDSVNSNGTINISQYNEFLPGAGWGHYSERKNVSPGAYNTYIYF